MPMDVARKGPQMGACAPGPRLPDQRAQPAGGHLAGGCSVSYPSRPPSNIPITDAIVGRDLVAVRDELNEKHGRWVQWHEVLRTLLNAYAKWKAYQDQEGP